MKNQHSPLKFYMSFPITGYILQERRETSNDWAAHIRAQGHIPVNPLDVEVCADRACSDTEDGLHAWWCYMRGCIKMMLDCDGIYMLEGWERSKGALLEIFIALQCNMLVFYQGDILP